MGIFDLFSRRQKRKEGKIEKPEALKYDLPQALRNQIIFILLESLGRPGRVVDLMGNTYPTGLSPWEGIAYTITKERGLAGLSGDNGHEQCIRVIQTGDDALVLDLVDCAFHLLEEAKPYWYGMRGGYHDLLPPAKAIEELNHRFSQHGVGFRFENGELIKLDSEYIHQEVMLPALEILRRPGFEAANKEFMSAHDHFRKREFKPAIGFACDAFESVMKVICAKRRWAVAPTAPAKELIDACIQNGLIPTYMESQLTGMHKGLRGTLESGLPVVRNKQGSHGGGTEIRSVEPHFAAYALHLAATNILLLAEADRALP